MHAERSHTYVKDPLGQVMSSFGYGNTKITQHALKVSVFIRFKLDTVGKKKKERNRDRERQNEEEKREKRKQERETEEEEEAQMENEWVEPSPAPGLRGRSHCQHRLKSQKVD